MSTLQKVNLGTPPTAVDGDTVRGANTKANANVDVLNAQAALTSAAATITSAQALTTAHVGKRVNISLASAGIVNVPSAATLGLDGVMHLRNVGSALVTLAVASGSGDTIALTKLRGGEAALLDSDGVHAIGCLMRGRTASDDEVVNGNCTVSGNESVGGSLTVNGSSVTVAGSNTSRFYGNNAATTQVFSFGVGVGTGFADSSGIYNATPTGVFALGNPNGNVLTMQANGTLTVGIAQNAPKFDVGNYGSGLGFGMRFKPANDSTPVPLQFQNASGTNVGSISTTSSATSYNTTSDYRLKWMYQPIQNAASSLRTLRFYEGEFKAMPGERVHYVIAHELQAVIPFAVQGEKDAIDEDGTINPQSVDYSKIIPLLGAALQEALARIETLEARVVA